MRPRHIPLRSCIACGTKRAKGELMRITRTQEGTVAVDPTGKRVGRGAYLCPTPDCWERALRRKERLEYLLRGAISPQDWDGLVRYGLQVAPQPQPVQEH